MRLWRKKKASGAPGGPDTPLDPAVVELVRTLAGPMGAERQRAEAALERLGEDAVDALVQTGLRDVTNPTLRWYAVQVLGRIRSERALTPLSIALMDNDEDVRLEAVHALEKLGDQRAIDPLEKFASSQYATEFLRDEAHRALDSLREAPEKDSKQGLFKAVGRFGSAKDVAKLGAVIEQTDDHDVKSKAVFELGRAGDPEAAQVLMRVARREDLDRSVSAALAELGSLAVPALIDGLSDPGIGRRIFAVVVLEEIGDKRAVDPLRALSNDDPDHNVRNAAARAAERIAAT